MTTMILSARVLRALGVAVTACLILGSGVTGGAVRAQTVDPGSELGQFRDHRAAGMKALDSGDLGTASRRIAAAAGIMPDSPSILLLRAQIALQQKRPSEAKGYLAGYLARGYVLDLARHPDFNPIWDSELEDQLVANQSSVGDMRPVATLPGFSLTDSLAYAPASQQIFLSQVHTGKIVAIHGATTRDVITFRPGVAAYGLGLRENSIWASTAATRQTKGYDGRLTITSKIVSIDPANGQITASFNTDGDRRLGQLLMGRDDLYVTEVNHGEVMRLQGYQGQLQVLIPEGYMDSPMALVENADATVLIVADFVSGLYRVDLTSGMMQRLLPPDQGSTLGFSALTRHGNDLIAVQNGFKPNRVLRLRMSDDWSQITAVETVLRSKLLSQPTQGAVSGDHFVFVAKSQWDHLDSMKADSPEPEPVTIATLKLQP